MHVNLSRMVKAWAIAAAAVALTALFSGRASATNDTISGWDFESNPPGGFNCNGTGGPTCPAGSDISGISSTLGPVSGTASGHHTSGSTTWSNPTGNGSLESFSATNYAIGDYFQFQTSTSGFSNIGLVFDQGSSNTGPRDFKVQYSTDNVNYLDIPNNAYRVQPLGGNPDWDKSIPVPTGLDTFAFDFSGVSALNNASTVYFRMSMAGTASAGPATGWAPGVEGPAQAGGTSRVDNVTVYGNFDSTPFVPAPPVLPVAGDIAFALNTNRSKASLELVRGPSTFGGGAEPAPFGPWRTMLQKSVRFDNLGGTLHNVQGNLLGIGETATSGTASAAQGGTIWSSATQGTAPFTTPQLLAKTGSAANGQTFPMTQTRLSGLSVSPGNTKIAVVGTDSQKVIVFNYTAGNGAGAGAALSNARETGGTVMTATNSQGTAWLNDDTALALATSGNLYEVAVTPTTVTANLKTTLTLPAAQPTFSSLYYNTAKSPYVWAMMSSFASSTTTNTLYVLNPAGSSYSLVGQYDFSSGLDTAREIALSPAGDLFISTNNASTSTAAKLYVLPGAAANPASLNPADTVLWYASTGVPFASNNGFDIGYASAGLAGDYNNDNKVNAADYVIWRKTNVNGAAGYTAWRSNFGAGGAGAGLGGASVPEPTSLGLLLIGLIGFGLRRRRA